MPTRTSLKKATIWVALAVVGPLGFAASLQAASPATPAIPAEASEALQQMGKSLLSKQFSFQAKTLRVYADASGKFLHIGHTLKVLVRRPDRLRVAASGDDGAFQLYYDGATVVIYGLEKNAYVSAPVPNTIEKMMNEAMSRLGIDFPLADFLSEAPTKTFLSGVTAGEQAHDVTIDGVPCRHLLFAQPGMEVELWLDKTEQSLPRRLVITYRSIKGQPNLIAEFSDWNFAVSPTDADFAFKPPEGAKQVELPASTPPSAKK
jgi:hypothetical protein